MAEPIAVSVPEAEPAAVDQVAGAIGVPAAGVRRRSRLRPGRRLPFARLLGPLLIAVGWLALSGLGLLDQRLVPAPWTVASTMWTLTTDGQLGTNLLASLERAGLGLVFGVIAGAFLAVAAGTSRTGESLIDAPMQIKRAIPSLGLIPLLILWLGIGQTMKIVVIAVAASIPIYVNTHAALTGMDSRYVELAETLQLSRRKFITRIVLPGSMPGFFTGLRLAVIAAWTALVVVEQVNAISGIGYMMFQAEQYGQTNVIVVALVVYGLVGWAADSIVRFAERRTLRWRRAFGN